MTSTVLLRRRNFRALGLTFAVNAPDEETRAYVERIFMPMAVEEPAEHLYSLLARGDEARRSYQVYFDDLPVATSSDPSEALRELVRSVNQQMMNATPERLFVHASAAERGGVAALFPASMDSGKSTLVAGLVRDGFGYLTDEAVALDPDSLMVAPYPKPISLDPGSWEVLSDLRPQAREEFLAVQWQVEPEAIRPGAAAAECRPGFVVFPRYEEGAVTELVPMGTAEALMALAENTLNLRFHGPRALRALAELVRRCQTYRLPIGDLDQACKLVGGLLSPEKVPPGAGEGR